LTVLEAVGTKLSFVKVKIVPYSATDLEGIPAGKASEARERLKTSKTGLELGKE